MRHGGGIAGAFVTGFAVVGLAFAAAAAPDAGQLMQQMERELPSPSPLPQPLPPTSAPAPAPMKNTNEPTLVVKAFRFTGNTLLTEGRLEAAVAGFLNRPLTFADLQLAAAAAAEAYRRERWVVRAYLPEQNVVDGVVIIHIVEAIFGGTLLEAPSRRIAASRIVATVERALPQGTPVNTDRLDRAVLLLGDLPGLGVQGALRSGRNERETELVLRAQDRPLITGTAAIDNFGAQSTGAARGTGNVFFNSPLGWGDQAVASAIVSRGNWYGRLGWSLPVGYDGWRVGASASYMKYKLISADFSGLDARGSAATAGINASWPMLRTRAANVYLQLNADHRRFDNQAVESTVSRYNVNAVSAGLNGNLYDEWLGPSGVTTATVTVTGGQVGTGHPDLGNTAAADTFGYSKLRFAVSRDQRITDEWSFYAGLSGQIANRTLDSSEQFYIGGPDGLPAYAVDRAGGARGQMLNTELRWRVLESVNAGLFYDWARLDGGRGLSSAGLTLSWQADFGLFVRAIWANSLGRDPQAPPGDSGVSNRFWISATQPF